MKKQDIVYCAGLAVVVMAFMGWRSVALMKAERAHDEIMRQGIVVGTTDDGALILRLADGTTVLSK